MIYKVFKIQSGIDINDSDFKKYYAYLKEQNINAIYLDLAVENNSKVLSNPLIFTNEDFQDYQSIDDIAFIWDDEEIIGHVYFCYKNKRFAVPLSGRGNHLDERLKTIPGMVSISKVEYFCKNNIDIDFEKYISKRRNGELNSIGASKNENKFRI